jgi:hypothetical protein
MTFLDFQTSRKIAIETATVKISANALKKYESRR